MRNTEYRALCKRSLAQKNDVNCSYLELVKCKMQNVQQSAKRCGNSGALLLHNEREFYCPQALLTNFYCPEIYRPVNYCTMSLRNPYFTAVLMLQPLLETTELIN